MRRSSSSCNSSSPALVVMSPNATDLPFGTKRRGAKPPDRSLSYSRRNLSASSEPKSFSAIGS